MYHLNIPMLLLIFFLQGSADMKTSVRTRMRIMIIEEGVEIIHIHETNLIDVLKKYEERYLIVPKLIEPLPELSMRNLFYTVHRPHNDFKRHLANMGVLGGYEFSVKVARKAVPMIDTVVNAKVHKFGLTNGNNKQNRMALKFKLMNKMMR